MSMGMLRLPLVQLQQPPVLAQLGGLLLELLDATLVAAAALSRVSQMACGGALAGVPHVVTDHQNDHVLLLLARGSS